MFSEDSGPVMVGGAVVVGCVIVLAAHRRAETPTPSVDAAIAAPSYSVSATSSARADHLGVVVPEHVVNVASVQSGIVSRVLVRVGDRVRKGDALVVLDASRAEVELRSAIATASSLRAEWRRSVLDSERARDHARRLSLAAGTVSADALDVARYDEKITAVQAEKAEALANVQQQSIEALRLKIAEHTIRAPLDGVVAARFVEVGSSYAAQVPALRLAGTGELLVRFAVPPTESSLLVPGAPLRIDAKPLSFGGVVRGVAPEIDLASGMILVEAAVSVPEAVRQQLPAGASVRVQLADPKTASKEG